MASEEVAKHKTKRKLKSFPGGKSVAVAVLGPEFTVYRQKNELKLTCLNIFLPGLFIFIFKAFSLLPKNL